VKLAPARLWAMGRATWRPARAYAVAIAAVVVVTVLKARFDWIGRDAPVAIYLGAIMLVGWFGGTGPGLVATALSCLASAYFFAFPYDSLAVASGDDAVRLAIAAGEGTLISLLVGALRRTRGELENQVRERASAEAALRRANEHAIHSHKMRAIGELAGGIAHDFNNMITIVRTCVGLLERRLASDHPARAEVAEIRAATDRAAALARQLLTFARRPDVQLELVRVHDVLTRIEPMLVRLVGPLVRVDLALGASSDRVFGDAAQLEQAILNLAANARDAMHDGGTLSIATSDRAPDTQTRHPGPHLEIAVRDSGVGMDEETKRRAFEPFFTTKGPGAGTGLGLAMVFGIVEASDGVIAVESAPGEGATFRLVLPLAAGG
jgi:signal transduction histidine kinase